MFTPMLDLDGFQKLAILATLKLCSAVSGEIHPDVAEGPRPCQKPAIDFNIGVHI